MVAGVLAVLSALLFAVASVAQQRAASGVPDSEATGGRLIGRLVRRPLWWWGVIGDTGGYATQAVALGFGSLLLVQPLLVTALLFALPLGARFAGRRLQRSDWAWALVLSVSLAVFVVAGDPTRGVAQAPARAWAPAGFAVTVAVAACLVGAALSHGTRRAVLFAVAVGVLYGATAALTKSVIGLLGHGIHPLLTSWETYALAVVATLGTLLQQSAFQAGSLGASLPAVTVLEPVVAALLGVAVLHEQIQADGVERVLIAAVVVSMTVGTVALARSSARLEAGTAAA